MENSSSDRDWMANVAAVWVAVLIAMMGMSLVIPFLPLYLPELHVAPREVPLWAGWVGGVNFLFAAGFAPLWGTLADRFGRKPMAIRALIGLGVAVGLMGYVHDVHQLFGLRIIQGAFGGFVAEAIALVSVSVPRKHLGGALGFLQTAVVGGNFIGPLAGAELSRAFGYRATFRITGGALFLAMLLILFLVREAHTLPDAEDRKGVADNVRDLLRVPQLRWIIAVVLFSQSGMMLINPQITLFVKDLVHDAGHLKRWAGLVTAAPALSSFLMSPLWGRAGDRRGHAIMLSAALLAAALVVPWAALAGAVWKVAVIRLLMGAFTSALNPSTHSVVAHSVERSRTAGAFSLLSSAGMLGASLGPFASGPLASAFGIRPLFPITALLLLAASLCAARVVALPPAVVLQLPESASAE